MVKVIIKSDEQDKVNVKAEAVIAFVYNPESVKAPDDGHMASQVFMQGRGNKMGMLMNAATGLSSLVDTAITDPIEQMMIRALMMEKIKESASKSAEVHVVKAESNAVVPEPVMNEGRAPWDA